MLASARDRVCAANVSFAIVDYNAPLPFLDASFDAVLSGLTFLQDRSSALAEAARVLAPGGRVALAMWGPSYGEVRMMSRARRSLGQPPYPSAAPGRAVRRLERSGFSSVQRRDLRLAPRFASVEDYLTYRRGFGLPRGSTVAEHERLLEALRREALAATAADGSLTLDWKVTVLTADRPPTRTLRPGRLSARSQIRSLDHRTSIGHGRRTEHDQRSSHP
jgi:SAM-dependent methyltransferase